MFSTCKEYGIPYYTTLINYICYSLGKDISSEFTCKFYNCLLTSNFVHIIFCGWTEESHVVGISKINNTINTWNYRSGSEIRISVARIRKCYFCLSLAPNARLQCWEGVGSPQADILNGKENNIANSKQNEISENIRRSD